MRCVAFAATVVALIAAPFLLPGCGDDDKPVNGSAPMPATVSGTLTLPTATPGKTFAVLIDDDLNGDNGQVALVAGTCGSGTEVSYEITDVPEGTYFAYAVVWVEGDAESAPGPGDCLGYYGTGDDAPSSANLAVPASGVVACDIVLSVIEESSAGATVSGTVTFPEATEGSPYLIVIDDDYDVGNGVVDSVTGYCGSAAFLDYEFSDIPAGAYFVFSVVWVSGDPSADVPQIGDYVGFYGGGTAPPASPNFNVPETGTLDCDIVLSEWPGSVVIGSLLLPSEASGKQYVVVIDDDGDGDNGVVAFATGFCGMGTSIEYSVPGVQEGQYYYLYAVVWVVGTVTEAPISGDYVGFYGTGASLPAQPNFIIWPFSDETFDIVLTVYSE